MGSPALQRPDVLVLAGGGIVGEAWMHGVLAGLEDATGADFTTTEAFVGTSAGSIVAARLTAGRRPPRPDAGGAGRAAPGPEPAVEAGADGGDGGGGDGGDGGSEVGGLLHAAKGAARDAARVGWALSAPLTGAAVTLGAPVGAAARAAVLGRAASHGRPLHDLHARVARWGARFDGRLRVCAVDRRTGRRVVFGAPGAPPAAVADAVCASCAIPWVFAPVAIGEREYVDGGAWSVTNLDAARAGRGTRILCLDPTAGLGGRDRRMAALRGAFRVASGLEVQALARRGAAVQHVAPDDAAATAMGTNFMASARATPALAAGYVQGRRLGGS
ncbi:MAG TPA: patatin-like phospholipase family protein [Baekduia sp.]|uniref:patatin-like phospholipase family protein n=1 Tax=Baekduia sp. TaxID=2600305 RepID=UPI002D779FD4|nr:patatin-like phospholipase family protein [Baekduia sp.]HET6505997.1 patatin-like phospholipase family protein [Baekduia sp.]